MSLHNSVSQAAQQGLSCHSCCSGSCVVFKRKWRAHVNRKSVFYDDDCRVLNYVRIVNAWRFFNGAMWSVCWWKGSQRQLLTLISCSLFFGAVNLTVLRYHNNDVDKSQSMRTILTCGTRDEIDENSFEVRAQHMCEWYCVGLLMALFTKREWELNENGAFVNVFPQHGNEVFFLTIENGNIYYNIASQQLYKRAK